MKNLIECSTLPPEQQRIGRLFLSTAAKLMQVHEKYCSSHPNAVLVLEKYRYVDNTAAYTLVLFIVMDETLNHNGSPSLYGTIGITSILK